MKEYCVGYKVEGRYYAYVEAESVDEAREKAKEEFYDADLNCDTEQINVSDEDGNVVWER